MKYLRAITIILLVLLADQALKMYMHRNLYDSSRNIFGDWFILNYTENNGMAFGAEFGGRSGKLTLTLFRIIAVCGIVWYLMKIIRTGASNGLIICVSLILAGAVGNIIDSVFYGVIFGYETFFHGRVIDMLYFPLIHSHYPSWFPIWGGEDFIFFRPVFNIADSSISIGIIAILIFQSRFFKHHEPVQESKNETGNGPVEDPANPAIAESVE